MMKKVFLLVACLILFIGVDVLARNRFLVDEVILNGMDESIKEELNPIYEGEDIVGFDLSITIPSSYDRDKIMISPDIFKGINSYRRILPGEEVYINLNIINHSNYNYKYVRNSLKISTDDFSKYDDSNNYRVIGKGFDHLDIYDHFSIHRVYNEALSSLYRDDYKSIYLENDTLDKKLKSIGYSLDSIDKYYLDYFNNKYNLEEVDLNDFTYSTIKEIFTGTIGEYKEENQNINSLAYNYYYNKLLYVLLDDTSLDQFESHRYSIGGYMRNSDLCNRFDIDRIDSNSEVSKKIRIGINKYYYNEIFNDYNLFGHLEFMLEKDDYITPPNTGI